MKSKALPGLFQFLLPVSVGWSLAEVSRHESGEPFSQAGLGLLLSGIGAAYMLDTIADRRSDSQWVTGGLWLTFVFLASALGWFLAGSQHDPGLLKIVCVLSTLSLLYTRIKRIPFVKTLVVAFSWTWACSTLPFSPANRTLLAGSFTIPLLLLLSAGCILCDLKDQIEDHQRRIPTLPVILGAKPACLIAAGLATMAAACALIHHQWEIGAGAVLIAGVAQFPTRLSIKPWGAMLVDSLLAMPGICIALGHRFAAS
ncbi:MAG: UbiA family prenyltransferase [bacterium]